MNTRLAPWLLLGALASGASAQQFFSGLDLPMSWHWPSDLAAFDADGDQDTDLAISGSIDGGAGRVQVWFNDGHGHFTAGPLFASLPGSSDVDSADLDGDGDADLLVVSAAAQNGGVCALLNDGSGAMPVSISQIVSGEPHEMQIGDLDLDGRPDLVVTLAGPAVVGVLRNLGNGSFAPPTLVSMGVHPTDCKLADLQQDGELDLVALNAATGQITCRFGGAGMSFGPTHVTALGAPADSMVVAPLDGDAVPDALVMDADGASLRLLRGDGVGGWLAPELHPGLKGGGWLLAEDADLDGDRDVFALGFDSDVLATGYVLRSHGDGSFEPPKLVLTGHAAGGVVVRDLDGDHLPDLAVADALNFSVGLRHGDGFCNFDEVLSVAGGWCGRGDLADLDGDGHLDLALCDFDQLDAKLFYGDGQGQLAPPVEVGRDYTHFADFLAVHDFDGDGHADLLFGSNSFVLLPGTGGGGYGAAIFPEVGQASLDMLLLDLDGDGDPDVVTANDYYGGLTVSRNDNGVLQKGVLTKTPDPAAFAMGNLDGDGHPDALMSHGDSSSFRILRGDGAAGWLPDILVPGDNPPAQALALGDMNGDGLDDVISASNLNGDTGRLSIRLNAGMPSFSNPNNTPVAPDVWSMALSDLDLDGALDVLLGHHGASVTACRGDGAGGVDALETYVADLPVLQVLVGDLDEDGRPDLVAPSDSWHLVDVLRNATGGVGAWKGLGFALDGAHHPRLAGAGSLEPGSAGYVAVLDGAPLALAALVVSTSSTPMAFKGGTLVPVPPAMVQFFVLPASGGLQLGWTAWPGAPSGTSFYVQAVVADAGAPAGFALTDAQKGTVP